MDTTPVPLPVMSTPQKARYFTHVPPGTPDACWEWRGNRDPKWHYGRIWLGDRLYLAHRIAWYLETGTDPGPQIVCHTCDNPPCVNPDHLFLGTRQDNVDDMHRKGRYAGLNRRFARGSHVGTARLGEVDAQAIKAMYATGRWYQRQLGEMFGVTQAMISYIVNGQWWKHI